jgi:hypothetical protein
VITNNDLWPSVSILVGNATLVMSENVYVQHQPVPFKTRMPLLDVHLDGVFDVHMCAHQPQTEHSASVPGAWVRAAGDALNCVAQGILRGAGRPGIGAVLNSAGYW